MLALKEAIRTVGYNISQLCFASIISSLLYIIVFHWNSGWLESEPSELVSFPFFSFFQFSYFLRRNFTYCLDILRNKKKIFFYYVWIFFRLALQVGALYNNIAACWSSYPIIFLVFLEWIRYRIYSTRDPFVCLYHPITMAVGYYIFG